SVTVTDNSGGTSSATALVTSVNPARHPPAVAVAPAVSVAEASPLTLTVHAADPDGEAITAPTADLAGLPAGDKASLVAGPGDSTGILTWTPTYDDSGSYTVRFTAANDQLGTASTVIAVTNVDRAPLVTAPVATSGVASRPLTIHVTARDPDGDP